MSQYRKITASDIAHFMGVRLNVIASRLECETALQRDMHARLIAKLDALVTEAQGLYRGEPVRDMLYYFRMDLIDEVLIARDENEYCLNKKWLTGFPEITPLDDEELGPVRKLMDYVAASTGMMVSAEIGD